MKKLDYRSDLINAYFQLLNNLSDNAKNQLIELLKKSLKKKKKIPTGTELFGAWQSTDSADEIIEKLRKDRHFSRQVEDL